MEFLATELRRQGLKPGIVGGWRDELRERHLKVFRNADKMLDRNAVLSCFVFLYLLEGDIDLACDVFLALAGGVAGNADRTAQVAVKIAFSFLFMFSSHEEIVDSLHWQLEGSGDSRSTGKKYGTMFLFCS